MSVVIEHYKRIIIHMLYRYRWEKFSILLKIWLEWWVDCQKQLQISFLPINYQSSDCFSCNLFKVKLTMLKLKWKQISFIPCWRIHHKPDHLPFSSEWQLPATQDKSVTLFFHLVFRGDMKTDLNGARLPTWLDRQPAFTFPVDFMLGGRQKCIQKARFIRNQSKLSVYCLAVTLWNQHLLHNNFFL